MATKARPTGDFEETVRLPADEAKAFRHHAGFLGVTPPELAQLAIRMVADPYHFLSVANRLTEIEAARLRRQAEHRRMVAVAAVLSGKACGHVLEIE
jgi:hypothetical protein